MAPVLLLLVIAPLVAEFLLGDVTLASLPALVLFIPLYGGGAVLIREVVRRGGGGWPAIVVFAAAYGVVEEGLATQSLFNPDYAHQHLLSSGFIPALGIAIPWTVHVLSLHVIWSICTPIALVECMFPDRNTTPWLRTPGLIVIAGLYVLGVVATFAVTWAEYRYVASAGRLIGAAIIAVILIIAGMLLTKLRRSSQAGIQASRPAPSSRTPGMRLSRLPHSTPPRSSLCGSAMWCKGVHSGWLSDGPAIRYGVSKPSYMRWAIMPWAACFRL
jgi:hypothetical protein